MHQPKNSDCELIEGKFMHTVNGWVCTYLVKPCDRCWPPIWHSRSRNDLRPPIRRNEHSNELVANRTRWTVEFATTSYNKITKAVRQMLAPDWAQRGRNQSAQRIAHNFCAHSQSPIANRQSPEWTRGKSHPTSQGLLGLSRQALKSLAAVFPDPTDCPWVSEDANVIEMQWGKARLDFDATQKSGRKEFISVLELLTKGSSMAGQSAFVHPFKEDFKSIEGSLIGNGHQYSKSKRFKPSLSDGVSQFNNSAEVRFWNSSDSVTFDSPWVSLFSNINVVFKKKKKTLWQLSFVGAY